MLMPTTVDERRGEEEECCSGEEECREKGRAVIVAEGDGRGEVRVAGEERRDELAARNADAAADRGSVIELRTALHGTRCVSAGDARQMKRVVCFMAMAARGRGSDERAARQRVRLRLLLVLRHMTMGAMSRLGAGSSSEQSEGV